jgi:hypothetical protein
MESAYNDDEVGVVSYNTQATDDLGNGVVNAGANRSQVADAITALTAGGRTSIGAGIARAIQILGDTASGGNNWGVVLLSDGLENEAPYWSSSGAIPPVRPQVDALIASHPEFVIHTVAIGPDADQDLLEEIANYTGGTFYPVYLGESLSLFNRLADVYHFTREKIDFTRRILTHGDDFQPGSTWQDSFAIAQGTRRLQFGLNWDKEYTILQTAAAGNVVGMPFKFSIYRPNGTPVSPEDQGVSFVKNRTDAVFTIFSPEPGEWRVVLNNFIKEEVEALLAVSAWSPTRTGVIFGPVDIMRGVPMSTIMAFATDSKGFVRNSSFTASVIRPDKKVQNLVLRDDGMSWDSVAGDGIYTARFFWQMPGSYLVKVSGKGEGSSGSFQITETKGFFNKRLTDRDADGIPDDWEQKHAPVCRNGLNPRGDPDGDGMDNYTEWRFGSDPFKYDTDGDGLSDGEEYKKGTDPNDKSKR